MLTGGLCVLASPTSGHALSALLESELSVEVGAKLCKVALAINGTIGRAIAAIAIMMLGMSAFFGKATWPLAATIVTGIAIIFGAASIVDMAAEKTFMGFGGVFSVCATAVILDGVKTSQELCDENPDQPCGVNDVLRELLLVQ